MSPAISLIHVSAAQHLSYMVYVKEERGNPSFQTSPGVARENCGGDFACRF